MFQKPGRCVVDPQTDHNQFQNRLQLQRGIGLLTIQNVVKKAGPEFSEMLFHCGDGASQVHAGQHLHGKTQRNDALPTCGVRGSWYFSKVARSTLTPQPSQQVSSQADPVQRKRAKLRGWRTFGAFGIRSRVTSRK